MARSTDGESWAGTYGIGRKRQIIVRVTAEELAELKRGAELAGTTVSALVRKSGLGLSWQLVKVRELMDRGMTAEQAANLVITVGTGGGAGVDDAVTQPAADRL